uniref:Uncharacterized protein n=1 Tax=Oryza rufipogon TaxID=4529 RepID=A0A0E0NG58_ORYRU
MASRRHGEVRDVCSPSTWYLRYRLVSNLGTKVSSLILVEYRRVLSKRGGDVGEGGLQRWRMASRRHGEVRVEARAREREKSRGGAEEEVDGYTCCRLTQAAGVHPGGAKWQAAAGTTVTPRPRARMRGAPASALPGATTPRRTPDRRGSQVTHAYESDGYQSSIKIL